MDMEERQSGLVIPKEKRKEQTSKQNNEEGGGKGAKGGNSGKQYSRLNTKSNSVGEVHKQGNHSNKGEERMKKKTYNIGLYVWESLEKNSVWHWAVSEEKTVGSGKATSYKKAKAEALACLRKLLL